MATRLIISLFLICMFWANEVSASKKLIVVLIDGFKWDYIDDPQLNLKGIPEIIKSGVRAPYVNPVFPALSYPNWYSIVTGLYPESHGIINNVMYDNETGASFLMLPHEGSTDEHWWNGAEPIWVTAEKNGKYAAMYWWAGCEVKIKGVEPMICERHRYGPGTEEEKEDYLERIDDIVEMFKPPHLDRLSLALIYYGPVDYTGHYSGPGSSETRRALKDIDEILYKMLRKIEKAGLKDEVNIMIVSDHGMTDVREKNTKYIDLEKFAPSIKFQVSYGATMMLVPEDNMLEKLYRDLKNADISGIEIYKKEEIPDSYHLKKSPLVNDIFLKANQGYFIKSLKDDAKRIGELPEQYHGHHGFDPHDVPDMRTVFFANGPDELIVNTLKESEGKEVELACHSLVSHCFEILLSECEDTSVILRFMHAFAENKISVCTSANASHLTELLFYHALKAVKNWSSVMTVDSSENSFVTYSINWLLEFGNFVLGNLTDCLCSQYSCHVVCTLIGALAGDLLGNKKLRSKNLKNHKKEFHSQFNETNSSENNQDSSLLVLEQIPKLFSDMLKALYKALIQSENIIDFVNDSSSATVIEALIIALRKRHPKACRKMITKLGKKMCLQRNKDGTPLCLLHTNASFVFDDMFKASDEDLQITLWNEYISDYVKYLVTDPVGNFVIQRLYDAINNRSLFETACKGTWLEFSKIAESKNYGIFVSMSKACNRLSAQQSFFMENMMQCLQCYEPVERQDLLIPLLLTFKKYDEYSIVKAPESHLKICLQGSLVTQEILKFHKPIKVVKSILCLSPGKIEFLAGHTQGCHVLNAFFGSTTVGDKNKEKLVHHIQSVLVSMACDQNKSLTLSRIWTCLSLKLKEIIARELAQHQQILKNTSCGYAVYHKFGIPRFRKFEEWKQMQSQISCIKKFQKR